MTLMRRAQACDRRAAGHMHRIDVEVGRGRASSAVPKPPPIAFRNFQQTPKDCASKSNTLASIDQTAPYPGDMGPIDRPGRGG